MPPLTLEPDEPQKAGENVVQSSLGAAPRCVTEAYRF
jgi:hypothetical protein